MSAEPVGTVLYVAEPRVRWLQRPPVVADCSVLAALLFAESTGDAAAAQLAQKSVHAPSLLPYEIASVANKKLRAGADPALLDRALTDFSEQRIELHAVAPVAALQLAQRYGLTTYDAAYLWLAAELEAPLATFDRQLAEAARRHLGAAH
jgi:predicted nucleic acid-binding protein